MVKLTASSTFGQFAYTATVTVSDSELKELAERGFNNLLAGSPALAAEKDIANWPNGKKPKGFKRSSLEYNAANAATLQHYFANTVKLDNGLQIFPDVTITRHVISGKDIYAESRETLEAWLKANPKADCTLLDFANERGLPRDENLDWQEDMDFMKAFKAYRDAKLAAML